MAHKRDSTPEVRKVIIPPVIKLGAHEYRVKLKRSMSIRDGTQGAGNAALGWINIDLDRTDTQKLQTLLHEVVHQGHVVFGAGCKAPSEAQCDAFAEAVTQILTGAMGLEFDFSTLPVEEAT